MACPNDSITVTSEMVTTEDGKKKKQLVRYEYNIGQCMFCNLCVTACPQDAIRFNQEFENAVFDKSKLILQLNHPGSKCAEKPKPAVAPKPAAPVVKAAARAESEKQDAASEVRGAASEKQDAVSETSETKKED